NDHCSSKSYVRAGSTPAVISALALGLLHPSQPTLPGRLGTSRPCQLPTCGRMIVDVQIDPLFDTTGGLPMSFFCAGMLGLALLTIVQVVETRACTHKSRLEPAT